MRLGGIYVLPMKEIISSFGYNGPIATTAKYAFVEGTGSIVGRPRQPRMDGLDRAGKFNRWQGEHSERNDSYEDRETSVSAEQQFPVSDGTILAAQGRRETF